MVKKYDVIYADPPWKYGSKGPRKGRFGNLPYESMATKEIASMSVGKLSNDNSALFLWATSAFIPDAVLVMECWGFKFVRIDSVWSKITVNGNPDATCGPWGMTDAEFLMMGVRGSMCGKQTGIRNLNTVVRHVLLEHSEKPDIFRQRIEHRFSFANKLEVFARQQVRDWDVYGNEVENSIII